MALPNKLYFLLAVAWWILLMGFHEPAFGSCTSSALHLFKFCPCALVIFQLSPCPLPRILSQCWWPCWALGNCLGDQLGWPCVDGVLTAHPGTDWCFHKFVWQKCQSWSCCVVGLVCHGDPLAKPGWLTGREQVTAVTPRDSSCLVTLHSQRLLRSGQNLPSTLRLTGDAHKWKKSFLSPWKGLEIKWAKAFCKGLHQMNFSICCSRLLTLTHPSLDSCIWHMHDDFLQWEWLCGGHVGVIRLLVPPLLPSPTNVPSTGTEWHLATSQWAWWQWEPPALL